MEHVLTRFHISPLCFVADNASNAVLANSQLVDWAETIRKAALGACTSAVSEDDDPNDEQQDDIIEADGYFDPDPKVLTDLRTALGLPTDAIGCHCHSLELAIKDALNHSTVKARLKNLKAFVAKYNKGSATRAFILQCCPPGSKAPYLPKSGKTRWSSTYRMISAFVARQKDFDEAAVKYGQRRQGEDLPGMEDLDLLCNPTTRDLLQNLQSLLEPVAEAVAFLEADKYPTLSWVQWVAWKLLKHVDTLTDLENTKRRRSDTFLAVMKALKMSIAQRFIMPVPGPDGYISIDFVASALDPRTKELAFLAPQAAELIWQHIIELVAQTEDPSKRAEPHQDVGSTQEDAQPRRFSFFAPAQLASASASAAEEVDEYRKKKINNAIFKSSDSTLSFWSTHELLFPRLAILARNYLAIPASSATVERVFSRAGNVMTKKRTLLSGSCMEAQTIFPINKPFLDYLDAQSKKRAREVQEGDV